MVTLLLYPVRESNASLILRRDSFYPSELTRLISAGEYSKISLFYQANTAFSLKFKGCQDIFIATTLEDF